METSSHNTEKCKENSDDLSDDFLDIIDELNYALESYNLPSSVHCEYNPTIYARNTFETFVRKYCNSKKPIMYLGMNPGPWGMSQTGVPFGEIDTVKNWLQIEGPVGKPPVEVASRPVKGFQCRRSEVSEKRFWGLFKTLCHTPDKFFESSFVYNYSPQQWLKKNGSNITPGECKSNEVKQLYTICDRTLYKVIKLYEVKIIVCIGKFSETRAKKVLETNSCSDSIQIIYMLHPSPLAGSHSKWKETSLELLKTHNLLQYYD